jgi:CheY-like chemotaxis protein
LVSSEQRPRIQADACGQAKDPELPPSSLRVTHVHQTDDTVMSQPRILVINDDRALIETRRMLLEDCGAIVFTARGSEEAVRETLHDPVDLVVIDATNVGLEQGEKLCGIVKTLRPSDCVAILVTPEIDIPSNNLADRVIHRTGPRSILVELNEVLDGRLDVDLWEGKHLDEDEDRSTGNSE